MKTFQISQTLRLFWIFKTVMEPPVQKWTPNLRVGFSCAVQPDLGRARKWPLEKNNLERNGKSESRGGIFREILGSPPTKMATLSKRNKHCHSKIFGSKLHFQQFSRFRFQRPANSCLKRSAKMVKFGPKTLRSAVRTQFATVWLVNVYHCRFAL